MANAKGPTGPSQKTIKRLFALSGNRCAFPKCKAALVSEGTIIGEICHIKAASPDGPRYDPQQSDAERHGFENLILLCGNHHTVIDDDEESYSVQRIFRMKNSHEALQTQMSEDDASKGATLLLSVNQSGGITAHSIHAHTINVHAALARIDQDTARESILARARKLHEDRTAIIAPGTGSVPVLDGGVIVMHVVPFSAVNGRPAPRFDEISHNPERFPPIGSIRLDSRINFDGLLTGSNGEGLDKPQRAYTQVFRSGAIEAIEASLARGRQSNCLILPLIQATIIQYSRIYAASLQACGIDPPLAVLVSLVQARGMRLLRDTMDRMLMLPLDTPFGSINDDLLHFGEAIFDTVPTDDNESAKLLNPILGHFANTAGLPSSPYFDADGNYVGRFRV